MISIIVAVAQNNAIGKDNQLLWRISDDLKRFKQLTTSHTIIMGRKTFQSLPNGALPNRRNVVISRNAALSLENAEIVCSLEEAFKLCKPKEECFIIGGGEIYNQALQYADKLYLTKVHARFDADTFFPEIVDNQWKIIKHETFERSEKNEFAFSFIEMIKICE
jgi:dihydrofolate reductase